MEVFFGKRISYSYWTTHDYIAAAPLFATIAPYFGRGLNEDTNKTGIIETTSSHWEMHGSNQNDCHHVTVEGNCYKIDTDSYYNRPYDAFPVYRFKNGTDTVDGNYMFPCKTGITSIYSTSDSTVTTTLISIDIWQSLADFGLPDDYYAFHTYGQAIIEDFASHTKQYNAWGRYYRSMLVCPIFQMSENTSNTNYIGRAYGYMTVGFDQSDEPYVKFDVLSIDRESWSNQAPLRPEEYQVERPDVLARFYDDPDLMFYLDYDWERAMVASLNQVNFFDSNGIAFAKDIAHLPRTILSDIDNLKQLAKVTKSGKLKIVASAFLSVHYGYKLLAADGIELMNSLLQYQTECTNHLGQTVTGQAGLSERGPFKLANASGHLNVYYNPYSRLCTDIGRFAEAVDLVPDFSNVWDMIPFSFVVDWFTNIGDLAQGIDDFFTLTQQSEVLGSIMSKSIAYTYQPEGFDGNLTIRHYYRSCRKDWYPVPRFSFQLKNPVTNLYHWLEGAALVVSKRM